MVLGKKIGSLFCFVVFAAATTMFGSEKSSDERTFWEKLLRRRPSQSNVVSPEARQRSTTIDARRASSSFPERVGIASDTVSEADKAAMESASLPSASRGVYRSPLTTTREEYVASVRAAEEAEKNAPLQVTPERAAEIEAEIDQINAELEQIPVHHHFSKKRNDLQHRLYLLNFELAHGSHVQPD